MRKQCLSDHDLVRDLKNKTATAAVCRHYLLFSSAVLLRNHGCPISKKSSEPPAKISGRSTYGVDRSTKVDAVWTKNCV